MKRSTRGSLRRVLLPCRVAWALSSAASVAALACDGLRVAEIVDAGGQDRGFDEASSLSVPDGSVELDALDATGTLDASDASDVVSQGRTKEVLASGFRHPLEIALADDDVFFTLEFDPTATVRRVQRDGGGSAIVSPYDAAAGLNPLGNDIVVVGP